MVLLYLFIILYLVVFILLFLYVFFIFNFDCLIFCFFFLQAEDGIRDRTVTGVQTCALPISRRYQRGSGRHRTRDRGDDRRPHAASAGARHRSARRATAPLGVAGVGKRSPSRASDVHRSGSCTGVGARRSRGRGCRPLFRGARTRGYGRTRSGGDPSVPRERDGRASLAPPLARWLRRGVPRMDAGSGCRGQHPVVDRLRLPPDRRAARGGARTRRGRTERPAHVPGILPTPLTTSPRPEAADRVLP